MLNNSELERLEICGPTSVGWDSQLPPNELVDEYGNRVDIRAYGSPDSNCPNVREFDHPEVQALREHLREHNGLFDLEICSPNEVDRAVRLFRRDGFVVVRDVLDGQILNQFREVCRGALQQILSYPSSSGRKYVQETGRLPHRYCYGTCSASRHMLHEPVWASLVDLPTTTPILRAIFAGNDYLVWGGGGDLSLPGAVEYQHLHTDGVDAQTPTQDRLDFARRQGMKLPPSTDFRDLDFRTQRTIMDRTNTGCTINFTLSDLTWENGPIRQIPGTHTISTPPPPQHEEPGWMRLSTLVGVPAGSGIFRDSRCWHGATPNVSHEVRALPSVEYAVGSRNATGFQKSMPYEIWSQLSSHGQRITRQIVQQPGIWPPGAGILHPLVSEREKAFLAGAGARGKSRRVKTDPNSAGTAIRLFNEYA